MEDIFGPVLAFFGVVAADTAIEKNENQITFENFIIQVQNTKKFSPPILQYRKGCMKGWSGKLEDEPPYGMINGTYNMLYDCLVNVGIITRKITKGGIITWSRSYTISKTIPLDGNNIKALLEKDNSRDYTDIKKCFDINFDTLSRLLTAYKYNSTDQFAALNMKKGVKGGKGRRQTKKTRKI